jgi:hypothetical protein
LFHAVGLVRTPTGGMRSVGRGPIFGHSRLSLEASNVIFTRLVDCPSLVCTVHSLNMMFIVNGALVVCRPPIKTLLVSWYVPFMS